MSTIEQTIESVSTKLLGLAPGPRAELRRMEPEGPGTPMFWRIAAQYQLRDSDLDAWKQIIRILAFLTPSGDRSGETKLHDRSRPLGAALCDGGDPAWRAPGSEPKPALSELRFARFLAMPGDRRGEALERIARMLARSRSPHIGVNCVEIARLLLYPNDPHTLQNIARDYYSRLDRAAKQSKKEEGTV